MKIISVEGNSIQVSDEARIMVNKKEIFLGSFDTQEQAADAYRKAAINYFGSLP